MLPTAEQWKCLQRVRIGFYDVHMDNVRTRRQTQVFFFSYLIELDREDQGRNEMLLDGMGPGWVL